MHKDKAATADKPSLVLNSLDAKFDALLDQACKIASEMDTAARDANLDHSRRAELNLSARALHDFVMAVAGHRDRHAHAAFGQGGFRDRQGHFDPDILLCQHLRPGGTRHGNERSGGHSESQTK